jgi:hypothetical protein
MLLKDWNGEDEGLSAFLGAVLATLVTVPYIVFFIVNASIFKMTRKRKLAFKAGTDLTTFFLFISIERMTVEIWGHSFYWVLIFLFLSGCFFITIIMWKSELDLSLVKIVRMNWRLQFLILTIGYFSLIVYGVLKRIFEV